MGPKSLFKKKNCEGIVPVESEKCTHRAPLSNIKGTAESVRGYCNADYSATTSKRLRMFDFAA